MPIDRKSKEDLRAFLEISDEEWVSLVKSKAAHRLVHLVPLVLEYQDDLEESNKFFTEVKELAILPQIETQLNYLDQLRLGMVSVISDKRLDKSEHREILDSSFDSLKKAYGKYVRVESDTLLRMKTRSRKIPKQAFFSKARPYWNYIDEFWPNEREAILGSWTTYFKESEGELRNAVSSLKIPNNSPTSALISVEALLKKRASPVLAAHVSNSIDKIKNYYIEEQGLIPGYVGSKGNWKVEKDDCPELRLPERLTKVTERFAFCRKDNKECPSFDWSMGSYVKCKSWITLKEASLIQNISKLNSDNFIDRLHQIAETDPFVKMLFVESEQRRGEFFIGKIVDDRLRKVLEHYPKSKRKGEYEYTVYMVANEPVFLSGDYVVAADKVLLETIGEDVRTPKQAVTTRIAGPVMRITFTALALRDPEFRDFLRKKGASKAQYLSYDVPFDKEEDIKFFLSEVRDEFGYKIEIFEILEDVDSFVQRDFGIYQYNSLPLSKVSSVTRLMMTYIPKVGSRDAYRSVTDLQAVEKLVDVANQLPAGNLKERTAATADKLRVGCTILIALKKEVIRYADGAVGIIPDTGTRWYEKDPDTGESAPVELVTVKRKAQKDPKYIVRRIDNGKEIVIDRPWIRPANSMAMQNVYDLDSIACPGGDMTPPGGAGQPPMGPPPMAGPPPMGQPPMAGPPPFGQFQGDDGVVYIVHVPQGGDMVQEPQPMGMPDFPPMGLPGMPPLLGPPSGMPPMGMPHPMDMGPPSGLPVLQVPPRAPLPLPPEVVPPFPPQGGPVNDLPPFGNLAPIVQGPPPAMEEHGPVTKDTGEVFVVNDRSLKNPDVPKGEDKEEDDVEREVLEDIRSKNTPGLKFTTRPRDPKAPSGAPDADVDKAVSKLRDMFKGDPRVKDVRRDIGSKGKPVLFVHCTMPRSMRDEIPNDINGFEVRVSPLHDSLYDEVSSKESKEESSEDKVAADVLVAPSPDKAVGGKSPEQREPGPYLNQTSGPPPVGDELNRQIRDIPKL